MKTKKVMAFILLLEVFFDVSAFAKENYSQVIVTSQSKFADDAVVDVDFIRKATGPLKGILAYHGLYEGANCKDNIESKVKMKLIDQWLFDKGLDGKPVIFNRFDQPCESGSTVQMYMPYYVKVTQKDNLVTIEYKSVGWSRGEGARQEGKNIFEIQQNKAQLVKSIILKREEFEIGPE